LSIVLKVAAVAGHVRLDIDGAVTADCTHIAWCVGSVDSMEEAGRRYSKGDASKEGEEQSQERGLHGECGWAVREVLKLKLVRIRLRLART